MEELKHHFHSAWAMTIHGLTSLSFWLAIAGVVLAWVFYLKAPSYPEAIKQKFSFIYKVLDNKYYFDRFNDWFFASGARKSSRFLWKFGDIKLIDNLMVNGTARLVGMLSNVLRHIQTGYIYHYAFSMIIGVFLLLTIRTWFE
jgi:NADH-quinone oxidoreductase subunit L